MSGTVLGARDIAAQKQTSLCSWSLCSNQGRHTISEMCQSGFFREARTKGIHTHTHTLTHTHIDKTIDRQTDRQTDRQIDRGVCVCVYIYIYNKQNEIYYKVLTHALEARYPEICDLQTGDLGNLVSQCKDQRARESVLQIPVGVWTSENQEP